MSKVYFDHLLELEAIEKAISEKVNSQEEKEELWGFVDEILHHKALDFVLKRLKNENHEEFMELFHSCPHDEVLIFSYLKKKIDDKFEDDMKVELNKISIEIMAIIDQK